MRLRRWRDLLALTLASVRQRLQTQQTELTDDWDALKFRTALSQAKLDIESHGVPVEFVLLGTGLFARLLRHETRREEAGLAPEFFDATSRWLWGMRVILDPTRAPLTCVLLPVDPVLVLEGRYREV